ncbi:MAG TPA: hypothetical protein VIF60_08480 [Burkholderiaceae bacterium]|jgi:hypothetical protein
MGTSKNRSEQVNVGLRSATVLAYGVAGNSGDMVVRLHSGVCVPADTPGFRKPEIGQRSRFAVVPK